MGAIGSRLAPDWGRDWLLTGVFCFKNDENILFCMKIN